MPHSKRKALKFIDIKMNICDAVRSNYEVPLIKTILLELRKSSNIPYQCPLKKDFLYEISNLSVTDKYMTPMSLPTLNFSNGIEIYESNKLIASLFTIGGIVAKK
ncbi:uncharacterized protein LOC119608193 [Lucilia sericata]|uniref:uncharacterized protein LOC119608193 n=1 Tax=Lucilia sericata TaxID=13632 RepID=UPI0018A86EBF|nr:uncharacterized protein LOC119608193 [Lucilia sericata]